MFEQNGYFTPFGISSDGQVAVGMSYLNPGPSGMPGDFARRWRAGLTFDNPGPSPEPTASWSRGCSSDGRVICGGSGHAQFGDLEAWVRDGASTGHIGQPPGHDTSDALGVSADGSVVVGYGGHQSNPNLFEAAIYKVQTDQWTNLGFLAGGGLGSQALGASSNGSVVVGWSDDGTSAYKTAFRRTTAGMAAIPHLQGGNEAVAEGVNADGSVVVGSDYVVARDFSSKQTAWRWSALTGTTSLGFFPGGQSSCALAVSHDGAFTVGYADDGGSYRAFIYDTQRGMRYLIDALVEAGLGAELAGWDLISANAIAGDGPDYWITGEGVSAAGYDVAWAAHVWL